MIVRARAKEEKKLEDISAKHWMQGHACCTNREYKTGWSEMREWHSLIRRILRIPKRFMTLLSRNWIITRKNSKGTTNVFGNESNENCK